MAGVYPGIGIICRWVANSLRTAVLLAAVLAVPAARSVPNEACYVRTEAFAAPAVAGAASAPAQSFVGWRRKTERLFEVDISVSSAGQATCSVSGVARLRGTEAATEILGFVVRPEPARNAARSEAPCQVFVRLTSDAVELRTTSEACRAQALCEGRVDLDGQRFDAVSHVPAGAGLPCFEGRGR